MLPDGFELIPGFLSPPEGLALYQTLMQEIPWASRDIQMFGRRVMQPRLVAWSADPDVHYRYSGIALGPSAWHPNVDALRHRLNEERSRRFNSVLLNLYRDGQDAMGWHADDEAELGDQPVIASVSLGAVRRMRLRPHGGGSGLGFDLPSGSLLWMQGTSQADWQHAIPRTAKPVKPRINLTFREVVGRGRSGAPTRPAA